MASAVQFHNLVGGRSRWVDEGFDWHRVGKFAWSENKGIRHRVMVRESDRKGQFRQDSQSRMCNGTQRVVR